MIPPDIEAHESSIALKAMLIKQLNYLLVQTSWQRQNVFLHLEAMVEYWIVSISEIFYIIMTIKNVHTHIDVSNGTLNQIKFIVQQLSDNFTSKINILNEWNKVTD